MPRKYARKNRTTKRRMTRRKTAIRRSKIARQVHAYKRMWKISTITASVAGGGVQTNIAGAYSFKLSDLPNYTELTALYDQYKITGVKISFIPSATEYNSAIPQGATVAQGFNPFMSAIDYDDTTTPTSEDQLMEYGSLKRSGPGRIHSRYIVPKVLQEVYRSVATTGYRPISGQWLDIAQPDIPHYGLKVWCSAPPAAGTATAITYNVYATYYIKCKNTR